VSLLSDFFASGFLTKKYCLHYSFSSRDRISPGGCSGLVPQVYKFTARKCLKIEERESRRYSTVNRSITEDVMLNETSNLTEIFSNNPDPGGKVS
jgi:hypothetical protein